MKGIYMSLWRLACSAERSIFAVPVTKDKSLRDAKLPSNCYARIYTLPEPPYSPTSRSSFQWTRDIIGHFHVLCLILLPQKYSGTHKMSTPAEIPAMAPYEFW